MSEFNPTEEELIADFELQDAPKPTTVYMLEARRPGDKPEPCYRGYENLPDAEARARDMESDGEICAIVALTPPPTEYYDMAAIFARGVPVNR